MILCIISHRSMPKDDMHLVTDKCYNIIKYSLLFILILNLILYRPNYHFNLSCNKVKIRCLNNLNSNQLSIEFLRFFNCLITKIINEKNDQHVGRIYTP